MNHKYCSIDSLKSGLGDKICPPQDEISHIGTMSLNWFRNQTCNLIIVDNHMPEVAWSQSNIISEWANKQDPESLLNFLDEKLETGRPEGQLYISQDMDNSVLDRNPDSGCA